MGGPQPCHGVLRGVGGVVLRCTHNIMPATSAPLGGMWLKGRGEKKPPGIWVKGEVSKPHFYIFSKT